VSGFLDMVGILLSVCNPVYNNLRSKYVNNAKFYQSISAQSISEGWRGGWWGQLLGQDFEIFVCQLFCIIFDIVSLSCAGG